MDIKNLLSPSDHIPSRSRDGSSPSSGNAATAAMAATATASGSAGRRKATKPQNANASTSPEHAAGHRQQSRPSKQRRVVHSDIDQHRKDSPMTDAPSHDPAGPSHPSNSDHRAAYPHELSSSRPAKSGRPSQLLAAHSRRPAAASFNDSADKSRTHSPRSPRLSKAQPPNLRTLSNRSLATVTMDTAPALTPTPRDLTSDSLSSDDLNAITALLNYLSENSYAHQSHVQLIGLLHKGFESHNSNASEPTDEFVKSYSLLPELRQAREAMDSRFAVGEAVWRDWLRDEIVLARSSEERLALVELMQRAVQDEPASADLWQIYVDWVENSVAVCHGRINADSSGWSDTDKDICRELFTHEMLSDVLEQAAKAVTWRIDASHLLWNRYLASLQQPKLNKDSISVTTIPDTELEKLFVARLRTPHARLDETFELFTPLIERLHENDWETAIGRFEKIMDRSRKVLKARDAHESKIQYAISTGDQQGLHEAFEQYLKWDRTHKARAENDKELRCSLFERALLHFPTNRDWWISYIDYAISQQPSTHNPSASVLPLIERATRHCPWAGELWARRILRSDYERRPHDDIEAVKHRATNSGLLDVGGMDDLLKVLVEWCSYLRRHAFTSTSTEDDLDTAEVGMTMALEDVQQAGKKLYGPDFSGDPLWRIEKIQIKLFSEARRMNDARKVWRGLVPTKKDSYEFWQQYYIYEITLWIHDRVNDQERVETTETGPKLATAVAEEAISQHNLDWPEKIHEMYVNHFQFHESVEKLQDATLVAFAFQQKIAGKRAREAAEHAAAQQVIQVAESTTAVGDQAEEPAVGDKRKREDEDASTSNGIKKSKLSTQADEAPQLGEVQQKRDREHLSITVTNLSADTSELDVRKFFRDCGDILSLAMTVDKSKQSSTAVVEFASSEEVEAAKTRTGKTLNGRQLHVRGGSMSTLYVTNYPPEYDENTIRKLFDAYGEIMSVRFPSLKYNNRRRFCYVQFTTSEQAKAAEKALDGKKLDGMHKLLAKISDPDAKKQRGGAQAEGRELFVKNIDNNAPEADVRALFERCGDVQTINLLKNVAGKRLGNGFVIYSTAEEATTAITQLDKTPFKERILSVTLAQPKGGIAPADKARKNDIIVKHADGGEEDAQARRGSDVSMASTPGPAQDASDSFKTVRERQVAILALPDTVTDARITTEMEKHGRIVKIQLRREQHAAIVEFADAKAAFAVREGIDCKALGPETRTADVKELHARDGKKKSNTMMPSQLGRPAIGGGARRGGLGFKRGGLGSVHKTSATSGQDSTANGSARSNADFKALFEKSKDTEQK